MGFFGRILGAALVAGAALAGNVVGNSIRSMTGTTPPKDALWSQNVQGIPLALTVTNFVPALLLAFLAGKPRTVYAFLSGAVISALIGDTYEQQIVANVRSQLSS